MRDSVDLSETLKRLGPEVDSLPPEETLRPNTARDADPTQRGWKESLPLVAVAQSDSSDARDAAELELEAVLGEGGMGLVYGARQRSLRREIAVKTVRPGASAETIDALCAEAVVTGNLEHPGIVPVHSLGRGEDGRPLLVMKRIEGVSWRALLHDASHPAWARQRVAAGDRLQWHLEVLAQLCNALAFAHDRGWVHRDLKPENVMIGDYGEVYLVDWGLALRRGSSAGGIPAGTPSYMAPEMVTGGVIDERTDVYLLGAVLHELLTGHAPHEAGTLPEAFAQAVLSEPKRFDESVAPELARLCQRALSRDPAERPQSAVEVRAALVDHQRHRASRALSQAARARLAQLQDGLPRADDETDAAAHQRAIWESHFGFNEARREWPENPDVAPGLQACGEAAVRLALARRDPMSARGFLRELPAPNPELAARIEALEAELAGEAAERTRLRQIAHDLDPSINLKLRLALLGAGGVAAAAVTVWALRRSASEGLTIEELLGFAGGLLAFGALAVGTFGRTLLAQGFNRRLVLLWAAVLTTMLVDRIVGYLSGTPVEAVLRQDMVTMGACALGGAVLLDAWFGAAAVSLFAGAVIAAKWPGHAPAVFSGAGALALVATVATVVLRRRRA